MAIDLARWDREWCLRKWARTDTGTGICPLRTSKEFLEHRLFHQGNKRLRVGKVEVRDEDTVLAEIETVDGSLVERLEANRHTGWIYSTEQ